MNKDIQLIQAELKLQLKSVKNIANTLGNLEETSTCDDIGVLASNNEQNEITTQLAAFESEHIKAIEYALQKIEKGTYGTCEECNKSIALARLQAMPTTTYCVKCKSEIEKNSN